MQTFKNLISQGFEGNLVLIYFPYFGEDLKFHYQLGVDCIKRFFNLIPIQCLKFDSDYNKPILSQLKISSYGNIKESEINKCKEKLLTKLNIIIERGKNYVLFFSKQEFIFNQLQQFFENTNAYIFNIKNISDKHSIQGKGQSNLNDLNELFYSFGKNKRNVVICDYDSNIDDIRTGMLISNLLKIYCIGFVQQQQQ